MATERSIEARAWMAQTGFSLSRDDVDGISVLVVCGELDIARAPRLSVAINEALRELPPALVIDLCGVDFLDSTGLAVLLNARRRTLRGGIDLTLACDGES